MNIIVTKTEKFPSDTELTCDRNLVNRTSKNGQSNQVTKGTNQPASVTKLLLIYISSLDKEISELNMIYFEPMHIKD